MDVVINLANLVNAGGRSVGLGIAKSLTNLPANHGDRFHFFVPSLETYDFPNTETSTFHEVPNHLNRFPGNFLLNRYLSGEIKKIRPDVVFSVGNIPAKTPSGVPQLVMVHWPYLVYPDTPAWGLMGFKEKLMRKIKRHAIRSLRKYVTRYTVQTDIMKQRLLQHHDPNKPVEVIPSSFAALDKAVQDSDEFESLRADPDQKLLLYLSRYYVHKNIEILIPTAKRIKELKLPYKILLTIAPDHGDGAKRIIETIENEKLQDVIVNLGPVPYAQLSPLINTCDAFLMPTLLETVGLPFWEAMFMEKPIFTSDLDFSRDICGDAGSFFDPNNAESIVSTITASFADSKSQAKKIAAGVDKVSQLPDWPEVTNRYLQILREMSS